MKKIILKISKLLLERRKLNCCFIMLASIFLCQNIYAQGKKYTYANNDYYDNTRDRIINNADYILEGILVRSNIEPTIKGYYNDDKSMIYTAMKIEITKILRGDGNLKLGTVVIIRKGGAIIDYSNNSSKMLDSRWVEFHQSISSQNTQLFFCKKNEYPVKDSLFEVENEQNLSFFYDIKGWQMIYVEDANENYSGLGGMSFNRIKQLYRFLKNNYNNIETKKKKDVSLKSASIKNSLLKSKSLEHDKIKRKELERQKFILEYFHSNKTKKSTLKKCTHR